MALSMVKNYFTYILASKREGVLYIGVTNNLLRRVYEHKNSLIKGFTSKYFVNKLVYYEECGDISAAISREKCLKRWKREWKVELIESFNPGWKDLYLDMLSGKIEEDPCFRRDDKKEM